jgi:hypothetical protein
MTVNPELARELRNRAIKQADENANRLWKAAALTAIVSVAAEKDYLTTDDIWDAMPPEYFTHEKRAMGAIMTRAKNLGFILPTSSFVKSGRPECHARPVMLWKSRLRDA